MNILLLKGFNNYFNRIVKKYSSLQEYQSASSSYLSYSGINFNPNDGVATELIIGSTTQVETNNTPLSWEFNGSPDYLVVFENGQTQGTFNIISRWFILECERTRNGQYRIALKRDVLADFRDDILEAPCYVEKGFVNDTNNPLLLNPENMSFNQIKQNEQPIIDESGCSWLVGYIKKGTAPKTKSSVRAQDLDNAYDATTLFFKNAIEYDDGTGVVNPDTIIVPSALEVKFYTNLGGTSSSAQRLKINGDITDVNNNQYSYLGFGDASTYNWEGLTTPLIYTDTASRVPDTMGTYYAGRFTYNANNTAPLAARTTFKNFINTGVKNAQTYSVKEVSDLASGETYASLISTYNNALVVKDGVTYKLHVYLETQSRTINQYFDYQSGSIVESYVDYLLTNVSTALHKNITVSAMNKLRGVITYQRLVIQAETQPASSQTITMTIPQAGTNRYTTDDALYDIFAVPYIPRQYRGDMSATFIDDNGTSRNIDSDAMLFIVQEMMTELGITEGGNGIDLQLLPYCPIIMPEDNDLRELNAKSFSIITKGGDSTTPIGFALFPTSANFTKNITLRKAIANPSPLNLKINNECNFYRLTSPNWNSMFEFKLSKFRDGIHLINIDCTYKPISPYIKLNPDYSYLYGADYNDSTGLILSGDFSLPTLSDPWINYQLNNKNYQATFNRQIQNLDISSQIALDQQAFQGTMGVLTGALSAGAGAGYAGFKAGGPIGAGVGALVGASAAAALGSIGASKDRDWLIRAQSETKSYTTDMYNYQLGNIKALPAAITKSDPLTYNNKIWPILEEFSCTEDEKELLKDKIKYNGMTIMATGYLGQYCYSEDYDKVYVKGQLIRLEDIQDDFHIIDAIYQEVNKGFYIPQ